MWWQEIAIIAFGYWLYSLGRNAIPEQASIARRHGRGIQHLQDVLHLNWELSLNHVVATTEWLAQVMNYYYATRCGCSSAAHSSTAGRAPSW